MDLETWVEMAKRQGASDLHLEPGMPLVLRVRGELRTFGDPIPAGVIKDAARQLLGEQGWSEFLRRRSTDVSRAIAQARCRVHVLTSTRGVGFAVRLLLSAQVTLKKLNLHPDLMRITEAPHGLVLISGPTGSGKSSTAAALLQEINLREARHIITIESPIEYVLAPRKSFLRQREVGRDTPSFEQALVDALREDPDVLLVGEMRDPETMRLTLNAAETGHLVIATVHSASAPEALHRIVNAFPPEAQASIQAQLADCLVGVVAQRLQYRGDLQVRVPECEVLMGSTAVRSLIRLGQISKLHSAIETGGADGSWTFARYRDWLARKSDWVTAIEPEFAPAEPGGSVVAEPKPKPRPSPPVRREATRPQTEGVLELSDEQEDPEEVLRDLERRK
jgi:twitching motility protein PilT